MAIPVRLYDYQEEYVDPEASGGWKSGASARKPQGQDQSNQMPVGEEPQAKYKFDQVMEDGQDTTESMQCGYRNPYLDPSMRKARREEMIQANEGGFVTRNNYWERL